MSNPVIELSEQNVSRAALESLVVDNPELERLEALLGQFNFFEALGAVRHELRHSDFLAFLLDPSQNHGLGDEFARRLLQKILISASDQTLPVTSIDLDVWDLNDLVVQREWQNIDILLTDETERLAVIIENKIDGVEHSNQLARYFQVVSQHYPGWKILSVYLTPEGDRPSHSAYLATDYTAVCEIVERMTERRSSTLGADVRTLMLHYTQMLRRHIVSESEIAELCRRIYRKHQHTRHFKQSLILIGRACYYIDLDDGTSNKISTDVSRQFEVTLADAAVESGVELREGFSVEELTTSGGGGGDGRPRSGQEGFGRDGEGAYRRRHSCPPHKETLQLPRTDC